MSIGLELEILPFYGCSVLLNLNNLPTKNMDMDAYLISIFKNYFLFLKTNKKGKHERFQFLFCLKNEKKTYVY